MAVRVDGSGERHLHRTAVDRPELEAFELRALERQHLAGIDPRGQDDGVARELVGEGDRLDSRIPDLDELVAAEVERIRRLRGIGPDDKISMINAIIGLHEERIARG